MNGHRVPASAPPAIWSGGAAKRVNALLDIQEDPVDVYRIVIPGGKTAKISVIPRFGDPSLEVFTSSAISVNDEDAARGRLPSSPGSKKTERVTVTHTGSKSALVLRRRQAAGQLALPGARVHPARRLAARL